MAENREISPLLKVIEGLNFGLLMLNQIKEEAEAANQPRNDSQLNLQRSSNSALISNAENKNEIKCGLCNKIFILRFLRDKKLEVYCTICDVFFHTECYQSKVIGLKVGSYCPLCASNQVIEPILTPFAKAQF